MTPFMQNSSVSLSDEDMAKIKNKVLEVLRTLLVDHVDPRRFITFLRARAVLDERECDEIKSASNRSRCEGAEKFLDILTTKGSKGYDQFCQAILRDKTQMFLLSALNKKLESYKDHRRKQVEKDYEAWKQRQQKKPMFQQPTQHKQQQQQRAEKHPRPPNTHGPVFSLPPQIRYPPNYRHSNGGPPANQFRPRSPIPESDDSHEIQNGFQHQRVNEAHATSNQQVFGQVQGEVYWTEAPVPLVGPRYHDAMQPQLVVPHFPSPEHRLHVIPSQPQPHPSQPLLHPSQPHLHPSQPQFHPSQSHLHPSQPHLHPSQPQLHPSQPHLHPSQPHLHPSQPHMHTHSAPCDIRPVEPPPQQVIEHRHFYTADCITSSQPLPMQEPVHAFVDFPCGEGGQ